MKTKRQNYALTIFLGLAFVLVGCEPVNEYFGLQNDNVVEEGAEGLIQMETGFSVDLTPMSPEK